MYFEDLKVGMTVQIAPAVIEKQRMLEFARTYDHIPLHTDEVYAKASPFGQLIAPGVMSFMSVWARYLEVDFFRQRAAGRQIHENRVAQARLCGGCAPGPGRDHEAAAQKCQKQPGGDHHPRLQPARRPGPDGRDRGHRQMQTSVTDAVIQNPHQKRACCKVYCNTPSR